MIWWERKRSKRPTIFITLLTWTEVNGRLTIKGSHCCSHSRPAGGFTSSQLEQMLSFNFSLFVVSSHSTNVNTLRVCVGCLGLLSMLTNFSLDQCPMGHVTTLVMMHLCVKKPFTYKYILFFVFFFLLVKSTYEKHLCGKYLQKQTWHSMAEHKPRLPPFHCKFSVCRRRIQCRLEAK